MNIEQLTNASVTFYGPAIEEEVISIRAGINSLNVPTRYVWLRNATGFIDLTALGANVAGGFPSGMTPLQTRVREVEIAVELGADEIDRLINRPLGLAQKCPLLYAELMSVITRSPNLVAVRPTGDLDCLKNVYRAALMAMLAGADFIKTSTGKITVNATLPMGIVMCRAIKDYYKHTGRKVGLNLDRGIKEPQDALEWMLLVVTELGKEWLTKDLFKFGESKLLDNIVEEMNSD